MGLTIYKSISKPTNNTLGPRYDGRHFADDIFKYIFLNGNICSLVKISLKFVSMVRMNRILSLVQIMAWHQLLSGPMMVSLVTHILVIRPGYLSMSRWQNLHVPWKKWPPFCKHILTKFSLKIVPKGPIENKLSIGLDYGLTLNRRLAIFRSNADPIHWRINAALVELSVLWPSFTMINYQSAVHPFDIHLAKPCQD